MCSRRSYRMWGRGMARTSASLPGGLRLSDYLSVGVIGRVFPRAAVREALRRTERASVRQRALSADVMTYYVIAMALFRQASTREVLRSLMEGLRWVSPELLVRVSGKSSISRVRSRLGPAPLAALREACVRPLAAPSTAGAWYRGRRLMAVDESSLSVPDEEANRRHFGLPGASRGQAGFPKLRLSVLMELGTRAPLAWCGGPWSESEMKQAERLVTHLEPGMLMLADRYDGGFPLWSAAQDRGANLLWRVKSNQAFPVHGSFPDGSWSSVINGSGKDRRRRRGQRAVRVVHYLMPGLEEAFTLITTLLDPEQAPAAELAALYHERWKIETAYDEVKDPHAGARRAPAQQDPGARAAGARRPDAGPLRRALPDPRGRRQRRSGPAPIILPARGQRRAPPDRPSRRFPPTGRADER